MTATVTVLYFNDDCLSLEFCYLEDLPHGKSGRVILPGQFRQGKSILAIVEGKANVLNRLGDRISASEPMLEIEPVNQTGSM